MYVSLRMQALEYKRRILILIIIAILPVVFWLSIYYTAGENIVPIDVPASSGTLKMMVPEKKSYPTHLGFMGLVWVVAVAAFFSTSGGIERDRRLVLCGYRSWQILGARLILLTVFALLISILLLPLYISLLSPMYPGIIWLSLFLGGLISMEIGLLVGAGVPRSTEGVLIIIGLIGIGMSIQGTAASFFPMYPAKQLLYSGLFADEPLVLPFAGQTLLILIILMVITVCLWYYRVRVLIQVDMTK